MSGMLRRWLRSASAPGALSPLALTEITWRARVPMGRVASSARSSRGLRSSASSRVISGECSTEGGASGVAGSKRRTVAPRNCQTPRSLPAGFLRPDQPNQPAGLVPFEDPDVPDGLFLRIGAADVVDEATGVVPDRPGAQVDLAGPDAQALIQGRGCRDGDGLVQDQGRDGDQDRPEEDGKDGSKRRDAPGLHRQDLPRTRSETEGQEDTGEHGEGNQIGEVE